MLSDDMGKFLRTVINEREYLAKSRITYGD